MAYLPFVFEEGHHRAIGRVLVTNDTDCSMQFVCNSPWKAGEAGLDGAWGSEQVQSAFPLATPRNSDQAHALLRVLALHPAPTLPKLSPPYLMQWEGGRVYPFVEEAVNANFSMLPLPIESSGQDLIHLTVGKGEVGWSGHSTIQ